MKISVAVVMSLDGKLTRGDEPNIRAWASAEDQTFFSELLKQHDCIVMGRPTYEAIKQNLALSAERLRVVLTTKPQQFAADAIPGKLEFRNQSAADLAKDMEQAGKQNMLLVGGPKIIGDFLGLGLIGDLYITLEPRLFGAGNTLLPNLPIDQNLQLVSHRQLNDQGTLLLHYTAK